MWDVQLGETSISPNATAARQYDVHSLQGLIGSLLLEGLPVGEGPTCCTRSHLLMLRVMELNEHHYKGIDSSERRVYRQGD